MKQLSKYSELILAILEGLDQHYLGCDICSLLPFLKEKIQKKYSFSYIQRQLKNLCDIEAVTMTRHYGVPSTYKLTEYGRVGLLGLTEKKNGDE